MWVRILPAVPTRIMQDNIKRIYKSALKHKSKFSCTCYLDKGKNFLQVNVKGAMKSTIATFTTNRKRVN